MKTVPRVLLADFEAEPGAVPREGRIGERRGRLDGVGGGVAELERFEVLLEREGGHDADFDVSPEPAERGLELAGARGRIPISGEHTVGAERSFGGGPDEGGRRDVALPFDQLRIDPFLHREPMFVDGPDAKGLGIARFEHDFVGNNLQGLFRSGRRPRRSGGIGRQAGVVPLPTETIELLVGLEVDLAVVGHRGAETFADEGGLADDFAAGRARFDDKQIAGGPGVGGRGFVHALRADVHGDVKFAVGIAGRALPLFDAQLVFPLHLARLGIHGTEVAGAVHLVDDVADDDGRAGQ